MSYRVEDDAGKVLSQHRTRSAAVEVWRVQHSRRPVRIYRVDSKGVRTLIVEGIWHEAKRGS